MKYIGINLIKYVQELYEKNYKALMNETNKQKKPQNKWRDIPCLWIRGLYMARCEFFTT